MLSSRMTVHSAAQHSPDEMFIGRKIRTKLSAPLLQKEDVAAKRRQVEYQRTYRKKEQSSMSETQSTPGFLEGFSERAM